MSRKWKVITSASLACFVIIGACVLMQWANSPARRIINTTHDNNTASSTTKPPELISTAFFTTRIPSGFRIQTTENATSPSMLQLTAFATYGSDVQIGITTAPLPHEGLTGVADYLYRLKSDQVYEQITPIAFPAGSPTFRKQTNGTELTSFLLNNGRYASVVVTSSSTDMATLGSIVGIMAENWEWL